MENPDFFHSKNGDHFIIEDLLDFPNDDVIDDTFDSSVATSTDSTVVDTSCNSSLSGSFPGEIGSFTDDQFSNTELCMPQDDLAELEWLSNFVEDSFSSEEDMQRLQLIQAMKARNDEASQTQLYQFHPETATATAMAVAATANANATPMLRQEMPVPAKARSKRSRAAPGNWTSRLLVLSPTPVATPPAMPTSTGIDIPSNSGKKLTKAVVKKREGVDSTSTAEKGGEGRKCLHCATDKTPQWRTGPMGPKTLCNACGVRYKSGRLVPEYRPAASPTFVLTKHSNSHRKVLELRRQKELMRAHQHQQFLHQNIIFDVSNGDDYLIHQHIGPDYGQLI